jgi:hypothetical protein
MSTGMCRPAAYCSRPGEPVKSTVWPASSPFIATIHARICARVAGFRPMVLAEV